MLLLGLESIISPLLLKRDLRVIEISHIFLFSRNPPGSEYVGLFGRGAHHELSVTVISMGRLKVKEEEKGPDCGYTT